MEERKFSSTGWCKDKVQERETRPYTYFVRSLRSFLNGTTYPFLRILLTSCLATYETPSGAAVTDAVQRCKEILPRRKVRVNYVMQDPYHPYGVVEAYMLHLALNDSFARHMAFVYSEQGNNTHPYHLPTEQSSLDEDSKGSVTPGEMFVIQSTRTYISSVISDYLIEVILSRCFGLHGIVMGMDIRKPRHCNKFAFPVFNNLAHFKFERTAFIAVHVEDWEENAHKYFGVDDIKKGSMFAIRSKMKDGLYGLVRKLLSQRPDDDRIYSLRISRSRLEPDRPRYKKYGSNIKPQKTPGQLINIHYDAITKDEFLRFITESKQTLWKELNCLQQMFSLSETPQGDVKGVWAGDVVTQLQQKDLNAFSQFPPPCGFMVRLQEDPIWIEENTSDRELRIKRRPGAKGLIPLEIKSFNNRGAIVGRSLYSVKRQGFPRLTFPDNRSDGAQIGALLDDDTTTITPLSPKGKQLSDLPRPAQAAVNKSWFSVLMPFDSVASISRFFREDAIALLSRTASLDDVVVVFNSDNNDNTPLLLTEEAIDVFPHVYICNNPITVKAQRDDLYQIYNKKEERQLTGPEIHPNITPAKSSVREFKLFFPLKYLPVNTYINTRRPSYTTKFESPRPNPQLIHDQLAWDATMQKLNHLRVFDCDCDTLALVMVYDPIVDRFFFKAALGEHWKLTAEPEFQPTDQLNSVLDRLLNIPMVENNKQGCKPDLSYHGEFVNRWILSRPREAAPVLHVDYVGDQHYIGESPQAKHEGVVRGEIASAGRQCMTLGPAIMYYVTTVTRTHTDKNMVLWACNLPYANYSADRSMTGIYLLDSLFTKGTLDFLRVTSLRFFHYDK